ncbi:MAG: GntR family transcriptional regulator [Bacteroidota bacterium]|nr:GntR family transcriptional regulator [Bacteroidota bacterium]
MKSLPLSTKAYLQIRKLILSNQLTAKTRLKEDEWASKIGVSRMALREALNRLHGEQLVSLGEKGGYYVSFLKAREVHMIRELREILEVGAIRLIAKKFNKKKIDTLEKICNEFTAMVKENYFGGACEADIKFHETIIEFAENEKLMLAYTVSHIPLFHHQMGKTHKLLSDYELTDKEHRQIVKALKERNADLAIKWLIKHFARGETVMLNID